MANQKQSQNKQSQSIEKQAPKQTPAGRGQADRIQDKASGNQNSSKRQEFDNDVMESDVGTTTGRSQR